MDDNLIELCDVVRNQLMIIIGFSQLIISGHVDPNHAARKILTAAERINKQIQKITGV